MRLWPSNRRPAASARDAADEFWYGPIRRPPAAAQPVTPETALTVTIVYDCLQTLAQSVGPCPLMIYERGRDGSKRRADEHPLFEMLHDQPNVETTAYEFWGQAVWDLASRGNFFAEVIDGPRGPIDQLWRLDPDTVTVERLPDGTKRFRHRMNGAADRHLADDRVWHLKVFPHARGGLVGQSPIEAGREAISAALALQDYAARFFANDATPPFVIEHPGNFDNDESRDNFIRAWKRWFGGKLRHTPGVLEYGMKLSRVGVNNEEAQFLETRKELAVEISRIWRIPQHKVGILDRSTNNNIEQQALEFLTDCLMPWFEMIEQAIRRDLILAKSRFFAEFNVAGLLRGDLKTRYEAYAVARQWGWLSVNDIRSLENMNPIERGDIYLTPLNMVPAGTPPEPPRAAKTIFGPDGRAVSRLENGNIVRLDNFRREVRHAA